MRKFETYRFKERKWTPIEDPDWFGPVRNDEEDWRTALGARGLSRTEEFQGGGSIDVFKGPNGWCVIFFDYEQTIAVVFIESASDYLQFRAQHIAPNVQLMVAHDQLEAAYRLERQRLNRAI